MSMKNAYSLRVLLLYFSSYQQPVCLDLLMNYRLAISFLAALSAGTRLKNKRETQSNGQVPRGARAFRHFLLSVPLLLSLSLSVRGCMFIKRFNWNHSTCAQQRKQSVLVRNAGERLHANVLPVRVKHLREKDRELVVLCVCANGLIYAV